MKTNARPNWRRVQLCIFLAGAALMAAVWTGQWYAYREERNQARAALLAEQAALTLPEAATNVREHDGVKPLRVTLIREFQCRCTLDEVMQHYRSELEAHGWSFLGTRWPGRRVRDDGFRKGNLFSSIQVDIPERVPLTYAVSFTWTHDDENARLDYRHPAYTPVRSSSH